MQRTTIFLEEQLQREVQRLAERKGISFAAAVREALAAYVTAPASVALPAIAGSFSSNHTDTAARADELLWRDPHA